MCIVLFVHSPTYGVNKWTFLLFLTLLGFNLFCLAGLSTSFDVMLLILVLFVYRSGHFLFDFSRFFFKLACVLRSVMAQGRIIAFLEAGRYTSCTNMSCDFFEAAMKVSGLQPEGAVAVWDAFRNHPNQVDFPLPARVFKLREWPCFLCGDVFATPFDLDHHVPRAHPVEHLFWLEHDFSLDITCRYMRRCRLCC